MTRKQKLFIKEYLTDLNATRAAISAGYSEKTAAAQGSRLLINVNVKAKLDQSLAKRAEKLDISAEYVLKMIKQTIERGSQGVQVFDREGKPTGEWKEDSYAVLKGCELLGKHLKMFTDRVEHSGRIEHEHIDTEHLTDAQLAEAEALIESAVAGSDPR